MHKSQYCLMVIGATWQHLTKGKQSEVRSTYAGMSVIHGCGASLRAATLPWNSALPCKHLLMVWFSSTGFPFHLRVF